MLTVCPGCGKQIEETLDVCPHCKRDFRQAVKGSGRRVAPIDSAPEAIDKSVRMPELPPHMLADINAPPRDSADAMRQAESVLPPHMLEGSSVREVSPPPAREAGSPVLYLVAGAVLCAAIITAPKFFKGEPPPPPPQVAEKPAPAEAADPAPAEKPPEATPPQAAGSAEMPAGSPAEKPPEPAATEDPSAPPPIEDGEPAGRKGRASRKRPPKSAPLLASARPQEPPPPPPARGPKKWKISGKVLDLLTLKPVANAELVFTGDETKRVATSAGGAYRVSLTPSGAGYGLKISHADYDSKHLPAKGELSEDERKSIAEDLARNYPKNDPINPGAQESLELDFVLLPRPKHGVSLEEALLKSGSTPK